MGWLSRNKQIVSDEYADVLNKVTKLSSDLALLREDIERLKTGYNSVRGLINRKLGKYEEDVEDNPFDLAELQRRVMGMGQRPE